MYEQLKKSMVDLHELNDDIAPVIVEPIVNQTKNEKTQKKKTPHESRNEFKS